MIEPRELAARFEEMRAGTLASVRVAVPDSGIDASHPDLAERVESAWDVSAMSAGYVRVRRRRVGAADRAGHGTAVASIVAGIAPNARLVDLRVLDSETHGKGAALVTAFDQALRLGCEVVCMSVAASDEFEPRLRVLCERAYRQGTVVVAARRNFPILHDGAPAGFASVISVDLAHSASLFGLEYRSGAAVEFAATGEGLRVARAGGGYEVVDGTSYAAAAVGGMCALLLGHHPGLRPFEVKTLLKAHAANG